MKRSDMVKEIKAIIRANIDLLEKQAEGEISYGKMAGLLAEAILIHIEEKGMLPPATYIKGLPEIEGNDCLLVWDEENT